MTEPTTEAGRALLRHNGFLSLDAYRAAIIAIEAEARDLSTREPGLDVERLARALTVAVADTYWHQENAVYVANIIAREYAALASENRP
jgi:hypothetical protein